MQSIIRVLGVLNVAFCLAVSACSSDDDGGLSEPGDGSGATGNGSSGGSSSAGNSSSGGSSSGGTTGATGGTTGSSGSGSIPTAACEGLPFEAPDDGEEACTGTGYEVESVPVDMFIIMDRSQSMGYAVAEAGGATRWELLKEAVQAFVTSEDAVDIGAGIGFYSKSGGANNEVDCDPGSYSEPTVEIGPLGDVGDSLVQAIDDTTPGGLTPITPALEGAVAYAKDWAEAHPERATVVVLVGDGYPTQCGTEPAAIAEVAKAAYENEPNIRTYVVGVGGGSKFNLEAYARSGGTREPFLTEDADIADSFVTALLNITNSEVACEFQMPEPPDDTVVVDPDKVQVVYTPMVGDPEEVPRIEGLGSCAANPNGGWYYDNPANPTRISVCPCTCSRFAAGAVEVAVGCEPRLGIR